MEVLYPYCAGLDVQKKTIVACCITTEQRGEFSKTRTFGTKIQDLLVLSDWLSSNSITHVALDDTGEFWKTVYNLLEANFSILAVNTQYIKEVSGRKTDLTDAEWIAKLLRHGVARSSFIHPIQQKNLRDLVCHRHNLVQARASVINNLHQVLESANVKLAPVMSDVMQFVARSILMAIAAGQTNVLDGVTTDLAQSSLPLQHRELEQALARRVRKHHRFLIENHLSHIDFLDQQIAVFSSKIVEYIQEQNSDSGYQELTKQVCEPSLAAPLYPTDLTSGWEEIWVSFIKGKRI